MHDDIEIVQSEDGLAILGREPALVDFLSSRGLSGLPSTKLSIERLSGKLTASAVAAQTGAHTSAKSGRWVKLTKESADAAKKLPLVKNAASGNFHATLRAVDDTFAKSLQLVPGAAS